ncbi:MAG: excinuclease ABC subunit UvrC [Clostridia bacterium]
MNEKLEDKIKNLPLSSGVYIMKNSDGLIIYVGKAKVLKNRVSQYFNKSQKLEKVEAMVSNISDFEYFLTPTELDAFILENTLIKKHQPYYNILLKDDKAYPYIKVNLKEKFPRFMVVRKVIDDKSLYFGPYFGQNLANELLEAINYAYPIRTCSLNFSKTLKKKRECLNFFMGLCSAPCTGRISLQDYLKHVKKAIEFLKGNENDVLKILKDKMEIASQSENFEVCLKIRDRINSLERLKSKTVTDLAKSSEFDVFSYASNNISGVINMLVVRGGKILGAKNFNVVGSCVQNGGNLATFISQFYSSNVAIPAEILINENSEDFKLLQQVLSQKCGRIVKCTCPIKGVKKSLVEMSFKNAENFFMQSIDKEKRKIDESYGACKNLKEILKLNKIPLRIECYDVSHISGTLKVASMVVCENGKIAKNQYRKFKINTVDGSNDYACLMEVLQRRIGEFDKQTDCSFSAMPDLVLIDGGKGQLSSVSKIVEGSSFKDINLISIAEKFDEIFTQESQVPVMLKRGSVELRLLEGLRDEAHRFAITFHRSLREKSQVRSLLSFVSGIGKITQSRLYQKFKTIENMKNSTAETIAEIDGISLNKAKYILQELNKI